MNIHRWCTGNLGVSAGAFSFCVGRLVSTIHEIIIRGLENQVDLNEVDHHDKDRRGQAIIQKIVATPGIAG